MRPVSFIVAFTLLVAANAVTRAQVVPVDPGENARLQEADKAFADAERALTIRLLDKAIDQGNADSALVTDIRSACKAFTDRLAALRTSDDGKRLAAALDDLSADQLRRLLEDPIVRPEALAMHEKQIASALADLKKLRADPPPGFVPPDQQQDELTRLSATLSAILARVKERDDWITSLIASAPKGFDVSKAPTLIDALADFRVRQQQAWSVAQRKGIEQARPEALNKITESARVAELERATHQSQIMLEEQRVINEQAKLENDMRLRLLREQQARELAILNQKLAESEARRAVANARTDTTRREGLATAEKIRLRQKCQETEVKRLLSPFTAVGLWQPGDIPGRPWLRERGPVSFSALGKFGALTVTEGGLTNLYIAGNQIFLGWPYQHHPDSERPKWGFGRAPVGLTQDDWQQLRHIQDLLNELGPTMVEMGMLSP